nr:hypothetical protein CKG001_10270 [Bdellovibrio sp. CKG001]
MTLEEFIEFLEPQEEVRSSDGTIIQEARGGALCLSAEDLNKQKTALEKACRKLGRGCTYEMKKLIKEATGSVDGLQDRSAIEFEKMRLQ